MTTTPLEKLAERRGGIEDTIIEIMECEKVVETIAEQITQFSVSVVQDEQLHQLEAQLGEADTQSKVMKG